MRLCGRRPESTPSRSRGAVGFELFFPGLKMCGVSHSELTLGIFKSTAISWEIQRDSPMSKNLDQGPSGD